VQDPLADLDAQAGADDVGGALARANVARERLALTPTLSRKRERE
jgi:hypothetical protein